MVSGPRLAAVALAVAVVLSGCTFGVGTDSPVAPASGDDSGTPTDATDDDGVPLAEHQLSESLDPNQTFERVERLVGEEVQYPPVTVLTPDGDSTGGAIGGFTYTPYRFAEHLDLRNVSAGGGPSAAGLTDGFGQVYIIPGSGPTPMLKQVLVHEFVHVVQFRTDMLPSGWPVNGNDTTDASQVRLALIEGAAVYVTDEYTKKYLADTNVSLQSEQMARNYAEARVGGRFIFARYHFGSTYVASQLDSASGLRSLYEDPPKTTEQILHNGSVSGPVYQPLSVTATGSEWKLEDPDDVDVMGELFVRVALSRTLSLSASAEAAAGWGNDRVVEFERNETAAFAWVLRWDDPANATEFRTAMDTYVERRDTGPDLEFSTTMVGDETVVVFVGPPDFVDAASASGTSGDVRVRVE